MSKRNNVKFLEVDLETRKKARLIYSSWSEKLVAFANRKGPMIPVELKSATMKVPEMCLLGSVCKWIQEQAEMFDDSWQGVLDRVETCRFLQKGYNGFEPNLAWLFAYKHGTRGIDKVLDGVYDQFNTSGKFWSKDEGV